LADKQVYQLILKNGNWLKNKTAFGKRCVARS
jgi:hypothetical protein